MRLKESFIAAIPTLVLSMCGGAGGVYASYRILESRVLAIESRQAEDRAAVTKLSEMVESKQKSTDEKMTKIADGLADIGRDISYVRGRMEAKDTR